MFEIADFNEIDMNAAFSGLQNKDSNFKSGQFKSLFITSSYNNTN